MALPNPSDSRLIQAILDPLLDDFLYWFGRSRLLLETNDLSNLSAPEQARLLQRIHQAEAEVHSTKALLAVTGVGVAPSTLAPWHQLVTECWQIGHQWRVSQSS